MVAPLCWVNTGQVLLTSIYSPVPTVGQPPLQGCNRWVSFLPIIVIKLAAAHVAKDPIALPHAYRWQHDLKALALACSLVLLNSLRISAE